MLRDGATGRVLAPGDVTGLAAALREVVSDGVLRERLARRGSARAWSRAYVACRLTPYGRDTCSISPGHA